MPLLQIKDRVHIHLLQGKSIRIWLTAVREIVTWPCISLPKWAILLELLVFTLLLVTKDIAYAIKIV